MAQLMVVPITCWLCALIAAPIRPRPGDEVQEIVYRHLIGRQQRLALFAGACTLLMLFALLVVLTQQPRTPESPPRVAVAAPTSSPQACYPGDGRCQP